MNTCLPLRVIQSIGKLEVLQVSDSSYQTIELHYLGVEHSSQSKIVCPTSSLKLMPWENILLQQANFPKSTHTFQLIKTELLINFMSFYSIISKRNVTKYYFWTNEQTKGLKYFQSKNFRVGALEWGYNVGINCYYWRVYSQLNPLYHQPLELCQCIHIYILF